MDRPILILTGARDAGKSTACVQAAVLARARGHTCGGLITLRGPGNERDVLDLRTGTTRRLTRPPASASAGGDEAAVRQGQFCFDPEVLRWGNAALAQAVPCHLLIVDEIGPLEIVHARGWMAAFDVLSAGDFELAVVVVRPELIVQAQLRLAHGAPSVFTLTSDNRDRVPQELLETLAEVRRQRRMAAPAPGWSLSS